MGLVTEFMSERKQEFEERLADLKPQSESLAAEVAYLEQTLQTWDSITNGGAPSAPAKRRGRPKATETAAAVAAEADGKTENPFIEKAKPKRGRPKGSGNSKAGRPSGSGERAKQVLSTLEANSEGLKISDLAEKMGMDKPNYLYRVLPALEKEGKVKRDAESGAYSAVAA